MSAGQSVFSIKQWRGLNRCPDGDTRLKAGEAVEMRNFRISRDGSLKKRPGTVTAAELGSAPVPAMWSGELRGQEVLCAVCGSGVYLMDENGEPRKVGDFGFCPERASIFAFDGALWLLTGSGYFCYDGSRFSRVEGYVPLVKIGISPTDPGTLLEGINKLSPLRRALLSPDGEGTEFSPGEQGIAAVEYVRRAADGSALSGWHWDSQKGTLVFDTPPEEGVNTIEICWRSESSRREQVERMLWAELYNGAQDTRVFLYGSGSKAIYSGLDESGRPRADYFPDLNEIAAGEPGTDITGMLRHLSSLVCFKKGSTWLIRHALAEDAAGETLSAFTILPVHRSIGSDAPGQAVSVLNSVITLHEGAAVEWLGSYPAAGAGSEERCARRISDRAADILAAFEPQNTLLYDDSRAAELYFCCGDRVLIYAYGADAWFLYTGPEIRSMARYRGSLYFGTADGRICRFDQNSYSDEFPDGRRPIDCYWESGSMDFGRATRLKSSARLYLSLKPESRAEVTAAVLTEKGKGSCEKQISRRLFSFAHLNFGALRFFLNRAPEPFSLRIRAQRFAYYKLILSSRSGDSTVTITGADIAVRFGGDVN